jgi:hypothetical protein
MSRIPHTIPALILPLCLAALSCGCRKSGPVKLTWTSMGTVASV